jgi:glyoxylase-like metal-dependent hydrolase (beta-lactamase superfamily II)
MTNNKKYIIQTIVVGSLEVNCYLFTEISSGKTLIIDPGADASNIMREIESKSLIPVGIVNTHGHVDHIGSNRELKDKYNIPIYVHTKDAESLEDAFMNGSVLLGQEIVSPKADVLVEDGSSINVGDLKLEVIHTPGHTPGGICLMHEDVLFTGDTLFNGSIGRMDLNGGSEVEMIGSLSRLKNLSPELIIFPGHGPASSILGELESNPFFHSATDAADADDDE